MARVSRLSAPARFGALLSLLLSSAAVAAVDSGAMEGSLEPALLEVTVNGQRGEEPAEFLRGPNGALFVSVAFLGHWRLRVPNVAAIRHDGEFYYPLSAMPTLRLSLDQAAQSIAIQADASAFEGQSEVLGYEDMMPMTPSASGLYLNYDLFVEHARGETSGAGAFEAGFFTRHGAGYQSFIASAGGGRTHVTRLETNWTIDRPSHMTSLRLGDAITFAGPGAAPFRFAGVQYARNFAIRPGYLTMPLPVAGGSAAVPSVVDVYVNDALQGQQAVQPGPFELSNIPVPSGGGTVQLVVRDLLGREIVSEQSYYASAQLLRAGLHDFSWEAGFLRERFGRKSNDYGAFFASTTHRYGLSDHFTGEATAQASEDHQMGGLSLAAVVSDLGQAGASASVSHSDAGTGFRAAASFERRASGLSFGLLSDYASADYAVLGVDDGRPAPRLTVQAFADMPLRHGGVGVNFVHRSLRGDEDETVAGIFGTVRVARAVNLQLYARHTMVGESRTSVGAHVAVALGGRRSASASVDSSRFGTAGYLSVQSDPPPGPGDGFRASARIGEASGGEAAYVRNLAGTSLTAEASYARGDVGVRLSAFGSLGLMGGRAFASRALGDSFAAVKLDGLAGVRVYADNQPVGVTDASGFIVIPGLRPFERNTLRIEQADLPLDVSLVSEEVAVRPYGRAGTIVRFETHRERGAILAVKLEDGTPLPTGAIVRIEGRAAGGVAVGGGEVYLTDAVGPLRLTASWDGQACRFDATVPESEDPQPRIEGLVCRRSNDYAAR
jgi:outer membrane usher protein